MNKALLIALQIIVKRLVKSFNYERIKQLILNAESGAMSGNEKKEWVLGECQAIIEDVGRDLVSLAIKAIVLQLRKSL